ncbi:MAG: DUF3256 family protein [Tannerella sp.]|jgi:hypothetical protein|nr:DUF3256 family protein [Tannerella sp.]
MRKLIFSFFIAVTLSVVNAQDVASFFISMPDGNIPQLEEAWRKDLVDLFRSGKTATLDNTMGGKSTLEKMTTDYLLLQSTERSTLEIKLLPLINGTYVACVITTVNAPVADSRVDFFTLEWKPVPASDLFTSVMPKWFIKEDADRNSESFLDAMSCLDMHLVKYQLNADDQTLTAIYTTPDYLNSQDREKVKPFLKENPKVYQWKSGRFIE